MRGTTRSGVIAAAYTDQVWEFAEKALAIQWAIFPGLGTISLWKRKILAVPTGVEPVFQD